ncbi:MAG: FlxA-like family protein [Ktedonobacterales bacterium]
MAWRELPHATAMSEFLAGFHGDCGQTAELCALHVALGTPLDAAHLGDLVRRDRAHGWADANGAEPLTSIAHDLDLAGARYISYDFSQPASFDWKGILRQEAGVKPVILQFANAGTLPGDEGGVHFHFVAALGGDPEADRYAFADGDNTAARQGALVTYTLAQLEAAQVCGMLVVEMHTMGGQAMMIPQGWHDDGQRLVAPNNVPVVHGFRDYILANRWDANNWPLAPEAGADPVEPGNPSLGPGTCQLFRLTKLSWTQARGVFVTWIGQDYQALTTQIATLQAQTTGLQAQVAQLQAERASAQNAPADKNAEAITALKSALGLGA